MTKNVEPRFVYEPIPHTDTGIIYCEEPIQFTARVTLTDNGKKFLINYDGPKTPQVNSLLQKMRDWFYYTHIKDAEDIEF